VRTALLSSYYDELSYGISLRETLEVWRVHTGMKAASQNYASAASLNSRSVPRRKPISLATVASTLLTVTRDIFPLIEHPFLSLLCLNL
jgi:hypothetical protein